MTLPELPELPADQRPARQRPVDFGEFVRRAGAAGRLVVQPRMGFGDPARMREGLAAAKAADAVTVGTLTLDSYTRVGELEAVEDALREGISLNGYPIVNHPPTTTEAVLDGLWDASFPIQVRHGSATPIDIFWALLRLRINATEGGPVSYCLPYGRTPLADGVRNWQACCELYTRLQEVDIEPHLETFGGCMMGQLCPPSQLVAISFLEAMFFVQHGIRSVSMSYAQQTHLGQDREAVGALRRLCQELLPTDNWHIVIYAYMGVYPETYRGAHRLLGRAAELAVTTGAQRIIVKTVAEARRIPTIAENVLALEYSDAIARRTAARNPDPAAYLGDSQTYAEARALVDAVLDLDDDIGRGLLEAFRRGYLDVPYCVHPDNAGRARSYIGTDGRLHWADLGRLPLRGIAEQRSTKRITSLDLLKDLFHIRQTYDDPAADMGITDELIQTEERVLSA
ncbi:methylaspartate mutase [Kitasatospora sp. NBC_01266]|jgi:methylaspartate mutase epsilon subunit|uniref:methylaspartate mutase n=1 Tax=Kitasatospora sp. NBC_01266 TaxID=2903572 RepID=UPI002E31F08B|nr:methylaspartate mutase [Kitasatospora sp. NBC_01266]